MLVPMFEPIIMGMAKRTGIISEATIETIIEVEVELD